MEIWAAIPAKDEENTVAHVITSCLGAGSSQVLVIVNGCQDGTAAAVRELEGTAVKMLLFEEALGVDVPRVIAGYEALRGGADGLLFVDGDLAGPISGCLSELAGALVWGYDLALTDCYPRGVPGTGLAAEVLRARRYLNEGIGRGDLGVASMSHGPSCVSRRFLLTIPLRALAVPPLAQALAVKNNLTVGIASSFDHRLLVAREKDIAHAEAIADCIIGDSIEALEIFRGNAPTRIFGGTPRLGAASSRRWDLLERYVTER